MDALPITATILLHNIACVHILSLPVGYTNFQSGYKVIVTFDLVE